MNKVRLLKLADFLETVPENQFDMNVWVHLGNKTSLGDCGTAGCALGWATKIFPELKITSDSFVVLTSNPCVDTLDAAQVFFEIDGRTSAQLFLSSKYNITPQDVSNRIRQIVSERLNLDE